MEMNSHLCFFVVAQATPKIRPRPAERNFETKVFELLPNHAKSIIPMKERWGRLRMLRYDKFNVPTCGNIAVCQECRDRQRL